MNQGKPIPGYFNPNVVGALEANYDAGTHIMMDSGAFSYHSLVKKIHRNPHAKLPDPALVREQMFEQYTKFCLAHKDKWEFFVTLDYDKDQKFIYGMQKRFWKLGLHPCAVYHGTQSLDWMRKHRDMGNSYLCIGGSPVHKDSGSFYLNKVFEYAAKYDIQLHGLAQTDLYTLIHYPFRSVDSSTWSKLAIHGIVILPDLRRKKFLHIHVSQRMANVKHSHHFMDGKQRERLKEIFAKFDFDLEEMGQLDRRGEKERHDWNGFVFSNLEKFGVVPESKRSWKSLLD